MISIVVGAITILVIIYTWYRTKLAKSTRTLPPGPQEWPLIGSLPSLVFADVDQDELLMRWATRYGPIYTFRLFNTRIVVLNNYELIHEAFMHPDISDRAPLLAFERAVGRPNNGIIHSSGQTWKEQRRFAVQVLRDLGLKQEGYDAVIAKYAQQFLQKLRETEGQPFDHRLNVTTCLAKVLSSLILGIEFEFHDPDFEQLIRLIHDLVEAAGKGLLLVLVPFIARLPLLSRKFERAVAGIWDFLTKLLDKKYDTFNPDVPPKDFVHYYLKEIMDRQKDNGSSTFDEKNLRQSCFELIAAGWDTSATAMNWVLLYLIAYPDVQDRIQKEIDDVIGRSRPPTRADGDAMPFTVATIHEVMRISTIVPDGVPHLVKRDTNLGGYVLPKGSLVLGNLWGLSRDAEVWGDPETFRPERFLDEDGNVISKPETIPFSIGRRICIGEKLARGELLLFTLYTLQSFTLKKAADTTKLDMKGIASLTYCTKPYQIRAVQRE